MATEKSILDRIRQAARKKILFLPYAVRQMSRTDRMISAAEVRFIVRRSGKIIENYPEDQRGHSCLILGAGKGKRTIHVVFPGILFQLGFALNVAKLILTKKK